MKQERSCNAFTRELRMYTCPNCGNKTIKPWQKILLGAGIDDQGRSMSFNPLMSCPACDIALAHDVRWSRLYNAVYFIFFSLIILIALLPVALTSVLVYVLLAVMCLTGFWMLGKMLIVPLVIHSNPFLEKIRIYFIEFGLGHFKVKSDVFDPAKPANSEVIIHLGNVRLRFLRDGLQEYVEFGDSDALFGKYYTYDDLFVAHGWLSEVEVAERNRSIGLYDAFRGIKHHLQELTVVFDPTNIDVALTKVRLVRDQRQRRRG